MLSQLNDHFTPPVFALADQRLNKRGQKIMERLSQADLREGFPVIFPVKSELKAFYRFVNNPRVEAHEIIKANQLALTNYFRDHLNNLVSAPFEWRLIPCYQDTTFIDYTDRFHVKLGYTQNKSKRENSALLHTMIVCNPSGNPVGIIHQDFFVRDAELAAQQLPHAQRAFADRESYKWVKGLTPLQQWVKDSQLPMRPVVIGDREADSLEVIQSHYDHSLDFIIRSKAPRLLTDKSSDIHQVMRDGDQLSKCKQRRRLHSRSSQRYYEVDCSIHYGSVEVNNSEGQLTVVYLHEDMDNRPEGIKGPPAEWFLLTSLPIEKSTQAVECLDLYAKRWPVTEDFHKVLKTGSKIEQRQFESRQGLAKTTALLSLVGVRLLGLRHLSESLPATPVTETVWGQDPHLSRLMNRLDAEYLTPRDRDFSTPGSIKRLMQIIGRLGGHQGYAQKGPPGWKALWLGAQKLTLILDTLNRYS